MSRRESKVVGLYLLGAALAGLALLPAAGSPWRGTTELHTLMEVLATTCALVVAAVALVRYSARASNLYLLVGVGFLGTAILDGYHALVTSTWFKDVVPSPPPSLIPWSWVAARIYLALLLLAGFVARHREERLGAAGRIRAWRVFLGLTCLPVAFGMFFALVPLPSAYYRFIWFGRPQEFLPAALFGVALVLYWRKGLWRSDAFEYTLMLSLLIGFASQAIYMSRSHLLFDGMFDGAHMLKTLSYLVVLGGLLVNMRRLYQDQDDFSRQLELRGDELECVRDELERMITELERSNKELDDFCYVASHDLKEPLRGISHSIGFLLEDHGEELNDDVTERLENLPKMTERMEALLSSLLHYSRLGRAEFDRRSVDLAEVLGDVERALAGRIAESGAHIEVRGELPVVSCNRAAVEEILTNLVSNALKYSDDGPRVSIHCSVHPVTGHARVHVADEGIGIRERHLQSIFTIFKRLHSRERYGGGVGVGLTIVKKLVDRHGGEIDVSSEAGEGATFSFTLGVAPEVSLAA